MNIKPKLLSSISFLSKKPHFATSIVITAIVCISVAAGIIATVAHNNTAHQNQSKNTYSQKISSISSSSSNNSNSSLASKPVSNSKTSSPSRNSSQKNSIAYGKNHSASSQPKNGVQSNVTANTQAQTANTNNNDYVIAVRHNISTYKSLIASDTQRVNETQQALQNIENNKGVKVLDNGNWENFADPEKIKCVQDTLTSVQNMLNKDKSELIYWEGIANKGNISY